MNYQIGNNNRQFGYDNSLFDGAGISGGGQAGRESSNILNGSSVGDLLACRLVQAGREPILDINGIQIHTKATQELDQAQEGDTIYLKIQQADRNQVSLKIVGFEPKEQKTGPEPAGGAQLMPGTEQFSEMIQENLGGVSGDVEAKENQKEILQNISPDEIAKLRMMQIDVTNATLSDLMGMVITIRSGEHQDEVNQQIGEIVKETLGRVRASLMAGSHKGSGQEIDSALETAEPAVVSRLNSEGYLVQTPASDILPNVAEAGGGSDSMIGGNGDLVTDEQLIYMVKNGMDFTVANLETAKNSVNEQSPSQPVSIHEQVWNDIYPQVTGIIEAAGMSVTEQSLSGARFMLQYELPVTVDSLRFYMSVHALNQRGIPESQLEENMNEQVMLGNPPEQARFSGSTLQDRAKQLVEKLQGITVRSVDQAVLQGKPLTVSYLYNSSVRSVEVRRMRTPVNKGVEGASLSLSGAAQEGYQPGGESLSANPSAVTARRQLEEIRLSMTLEAASRLVRQDIHIDARPLSQIVDALRQQENLYYENVASTLDLHDIPEGLDLLKETLKETDSLKRMPEYALGEVVKRPSITVAAFYETASRIKTDMAGRAYVTMMTRPRRDMGDSMTDAFQNVDAILKDLNLDRNESNQRAVRILAYNEMELNQTNIASVKATDAKVQQMFETLTPQIVLNLIRENKNPLHMTIDGLNEEIMQQKEILGVTDEQRFSEFLYQMDRTNAIREDERQSFIGIYRLLDKVEKSHGKDIGAVIRNGQEVTLGNLFAADKSRRARGIDVAVHENFGERVEVGAGESSILEQIETAYNQTLVGSMLRHIRPETLQNLKTMDYQNMSLEELNAILRAGDNGEGETELTEELADTMRKALSCEEDVEMMLEANDMPKTVTNIMAAHQVMYGEDGIYGMIRDLKLRLPKEKRDRITAREDRMLENLEHKSDVIYGLEHIRSAFSEAIHEKEEDGTITAMDIQALKYLNAGMPIAMRAVEEDVFQIPLVIGDQVSIMKVSILQDGSHAGEITATMDTPNYGELEACIHVTGNQLEGYVVTEEESGQKVLETNELTLRSVFAKAGIEVRDLRLDGTKPMQYASGQEGGEVAVSRLYKVAKQLLTAIKLTGVAADNYIS